MRVHGIQLGYDDEETFDARLRRVTDLVRAQEHADLVVLPELWLPTGFGFRHWAGVAEPVDGPIISAIAEAARDLNTVVHAGSIIERDDAGMLWNTSVLLGPDGNVLATYRKIHRFGFSTGEPELLQPGTEVVTVDVPAGTLAERPVRVGLATCYDLRFPELFRALLDAGAELVIVPAAWPEPRVAQWTLLGQARAIENQLCLVAVNTTGTHAGHEMGGCSQVVAADGRVLGDLGSAETILIVDVDLDDTARYRRDFPVLADRRL